MVVKKLLSKIDGENYIQTTHIFNNPEPIRAISSPIAWKILELIKEEPMYPLQIAKRLGIHEQKIYYHIKRLIDAKAIKVVKEEKIKGSTAKYYSPSAPVFALDLGYNYKKLSDNSINYPEAVEFFNEFNNNKFDGYIVVGSPEAHGPLKSWARDGHYSNYISMFLGNIMKFPNTNFVSLDTEINSKKEYKNNFILIGGPGVNVITLLFNEHLPVKFDTNFIGEAPTASFGKGFISKKTGKLYTNENVGVIEKIRNPYDKRKAIIVLAGISKKGTFSSIVALTRETKKILYDYNGEDEFSRIVKGYDTNGDGEINSIEVLE